MIKIDFSLMSSIETFTFTLFGSKDFNIKLISLTSYTAGGDVYAIADSAIYLTSNVSLISLEVKCNR